MAARALLKSSCERGWSSSIYRTMQRELSSSAMSDLAPLHRRALLVSAAAEVSPRGTHFPVSEGTRSRGSSFSQNVRWMGSRQDMLIRAKVNDLGRKKSTWTCPKCGSVNGASHQKCMGCQEPDSIAIGRSPSFGFALGVDSETTSRVALPRSIVKFCVLRSPHIDKKSREQFEMRINKLYMVVKTRSEDLQKKFFWLKRQRILGAQYEIVFSYKTRLPLKPPLPDNPSDE